MNALKIIYPRSISTRVFYPRLSKPINFTFRRTCNVKSTHIKKIDPLLIKFSLKTKILIANKQFDVIFAEFEKLRKQFTTLTDVVIWGQMINASCIIGDLPKALHFYDEMKMNGVAPNIYIYTTLIDFYAKSNKFKHVTELLNEMKQKNIAPNHKTFTTIINHCIAHGLDDDAIRYYEDMGSFGIKDSLADHMISPIYSKKNALDKVLSIYQLSPTLIIGSILMKLYQARNDVEAARNIFDDLIKRHGAVDEICYSTMLDIYAEKGFVEEAEILYSEIQKNIGLNTTSFNVMLNMYCNTHPVQHVIQFIRDTRAQGCIMDNFSYNTVLTFCKNSNRVDDATFVYNEMKKNGIEVDNYTYDILLALYARNNLIKEMQQIFDHMRENNIKPDILAINSVLKVYGNRGTKEDIEKLFNDMITMKIVPIEETYVNMMIICKRKEQYDNVFLWAKEMTEANITPTNVTYRALIDTYSTMGDYTKAEELFNEMKKEGKQPDVSIYNLMIRNAAVNNSHIEIQNLFQEMKFNLLKPDANTYQNVILGFLSIKRAKLARQYFDEMKYFHVKPTTTIYSKMIEASKTGLDVGKPEDLQREMDIIHPKINFGLFSQRLLISENAS